MKPHGARGDRAGEGRVRRLARRGIGTAVCVIAIIVGGHALNSPDADRRDAKAPAAAPAAADVPDHQVEFVHAVFGETEAVWGAYFNTLGRDYAPPKLVLIEDPAPSACGLAGAAVGPFYCPADQKIDIDLKFFRQLAAQFGASGAMAQAYVIAHEVGHHVQNLLGTPVRAGAAGVGPVGAPHLWLPLELQADCFAGVWAEQADAERKIFAAVDLEQGIRAAAAVGEDTLQRSEQGTVMPESFTHGSLAQRVRWFRRGFDAGKIQACDTFGAGSSL